MLSFSHDWLQSITDFQLFLISSISEILSPFALYIAPFESLIATTFAPLLCAISAKISPAFPAHWIAIVLPSSDWLVSAKYCCKTIQPPIEVAFPLPKLPHNSTGFPVITPGLNTPVILLYSSSIHAMICGLVLTSGAGISVSGPINLAIFLIYPLLSFSSSACESFFGLTMIPPFPHPSGKPTTEVLRVIHADNDITSSLDTFGWKRIPPLYGHLVLLCCDLYPVNTFVDPSSIVTGIETSSIWSGRRSFSSKFGE